MDNTQKELFALAHWNRLTGSYPGLASRMRQIFGSARAASQAPREAWSGIQGFPSGLAARVRDPEEIARTQSELAAAQAAGIEWINIEDKSYPEDLRRVALPPPLLFLHGRRELLDPGRDRVAIVGSRAATAYGKAQAERFAAALAAAGKTVVSGLARGIDETAHRACLQAGADTIAILGSGLLNVYPRNDIRFVEAMRQRGLLLSEFPLYAEPLKHHFPWRNRLISGLSRAVLVVEAAQHSGSLLTAHWAMDQGKEVWAIPGRIDNPMCRGGHALLREGVFLALDPMDLFGPASAGGEPSAAQKPLPPLLAAIGEGLMSVDELCAVTGRTPESILPELIEWEVAGLVVRGPGGLYRLTSSSR